MKLVPVGLRDFAKVDDEDYELVLSEGPWSLIEWRGKQYAKRKDQGYTLAMHTLISGFSYCHHVDNDGLNNQKSNLQDVTHKKNIQLQRPQSRKKSSKYRGVSWFKPKEKWRARLKVDGEEIHIGYYDSEIQAAMAWNTVALEMYGPDSYQNVIEFSSSTERR